MCKCKLCSNEWRPTGDLHLNAPQHSMHLPDHENRIFLPYEAKAAIDTDCLRQWCVLIKTAVLTFATMLANFC